MIHSSGKAAACGSERRKGEFIPPNSVAVSAPIVIASGQCYSVPETYGSLGLAT